MMTPSDITGTNYATDLAFFLARPSAERVKEVEEQLSTELAQEREKLTEKYMKVFTQYNRNLDQQDASFQQMDQTELLRKMNEIQGLHEQSARTLSHRAKLFSDMLVSASQELVETQTSLVNGRAELEDTRHKITRLAPIRKGVTHFVKEYGPRLGQEIGDRICPQE